MGLLSQVSTEEYCNENRRKVASSHWLSALSITTFTGSILQWHQTNPLSLVYKNGNFHSWHRLPWQQYNRLEPPLLITLKNARQYYFTITYKLANL